MTNPTPHGQVPEALIDLIDAYAETRHRCGGIYNARTEAARKAVIEALSGVQALSAAPAAKKSALRTYPNPIVPLIKPVSEQEKMRALYLASSNLMAYLGRNGAIHSDGHAADAMMDCLNDLDGGGFDETLFAASPTPPAEQQATKETSGGFHVWRDISTAPKDGSRFVAIGYNYGLYSEGRHICVAQWFRGCWMETSDWNEASELQHLTHWLPLPSPPDNAAELNDLDVSVSPQQAAPKAAPATQQAGDLAERLKEILADVCHYESETNLRAELYQRLYDAHAALTAAPQPAPESIRSILIRCREFIDTTKVPAYPAGADLADEIDVLLAAQPAPAPLSEREAFETWIEKDGGDLGTFGTPPNMHYRNSAVNNAWVAWKARAALAAQGGE